MSYLITLLFSVAVALALGHRAPTQRDPWFDHTGLRWRILHGERLGPSAVAQLLVTLFALWAGWVELFALLWVIGGRSLGWWMIEAPAIANIVALLAVPVLLRGAWTEIDADPVRLVIRRPWSLWTREFPWAAVTDVRSTRQTLIIETADGRFVLDAPQASVASVVAAARWLEAGRRAPFPPGPPADPAPPEIVALVNRAGARSAPRAVAE